MEKYYTGVGSRETPAHIIEVMVELGEKLARQGWTLRSGAAQGADAAFEKGMFNAVGYGPYEWKPAELFLPWNGYEDHYRNTHGGLNVLPSDILLSDERIAEGMAMAAHPNWGACSQGARKLHTRNVHQVLGRTLDKPSKMLVAWTRFDAKGKPKGGTATAIQLATQNDVDVFNLGKQEDFERIDKWLKKM